MTRLARVPRPLRVLLVEDNPGDADLTRDALEASAEAIDGTGRALEIDVVVDGEQAMDYLLRRGRHAAAERPDLILLDLNLPRLGGIEVLAALRRHDPLRAIPVVVLTSSEADADIAQSYRNGANAYVTTAGELDAFVANIQAIERFWLRTAKLP